MQNGVIIPKERKTSQNAKQQQKNERKVKHDYQTRMFGGVYILCEPEPKEQRRAYKVAR